ncbi:MAG: hypothetical protein DWQ18_03420 [Crenarchaeota archaeon]|nr:MAG: hypothetical protein DWQ17_09710 [Thermoproteota archaeon]RDJ33965.1 MAG: hypothetical protein DWQ18_03420 [Thermoproteota archaeon]RDJ36920.1 MAG: hypothetical protein DWQ13_07195 [Thermoproteota archaeon]RDJ37545.1 MAG: hypothetical protein DWQ19_03640 [Thermoproteota archaeon]
MLELTKVQTRILKAIFEIQHKESKGKGVTSYNIRNQKIPGRTFDINKDVLLYHQIIRIIREEKTGKQTRLYYELTPIGFFALIKSLSNDKPDVLLKYIKFIPHLGEQWEKYSSAMGSYHYLLLRLLKRALNELDILTQYRLHTRDYKFRPRIEETTTFLFEDRGLEIKLSDLYYPAKKEERGIHHKTFLQKKEKIWKNIFSKDSIQISDRTVNRLIFLFYFNAMKLHYDDRFGFHLFNDFHASQMGESTLEIPKEHEKIEDFEKLKNEYKKKWDDYDKFWKTKRKEFFDIIIKDVFDNDSLFFIFAEGFTSLLAVYSHKPTVIEQIDNHFSKKLIEKGLEYGIIEKIPKDSDSESKS